eukprot:15299543-Ditylum_brightwellii.AAC.1
MKIARVAIVVDGRAEDDVGSFLGLVVVDVVPSISPGEEEVNNDDDDDRVHRRSGIDDVVFGILCHFILQTSFFFLGRCGCIGVSLADRLSTSLHVF